MQVKDLRYCYVIGNVDYPPLFWQSSEPFGGEWVLFENASLFAATDLYGVRLPSGGAWIQTRLLQPGQLQVLLAELKRSGVFDNADLLARLANKLQCLPADVWYLVNRTVLLEDERERQQMSATAVMLRGTPASRPVSETAAECIRQAEQLRASRVDVRKAAFEETVARLTELENSRTFATVLNVDANWREEYSTAELLNP